VGPRAFLDDCEKFGPHLDFFFLPYLVPHCPGIGLSIVVCIVSYCMLWIFPAGKIPTASVGSEPAILGTRGQHANP
jgi:hypothetical protein